MSRIGKLPIKLTEGVTVEEKSGVVFMVGPKGKTEVIIPKEIEVKIEKETITVSSKKDNKKVSSLFGTARANISNAVFGVSVGWSKKLELVGAGFRAEVSGGSLVLTVGYSHPVKIEAPEGISFGVEKNTITVEGVSKEVVGQTSAKIRGARPTPHPY